jgi:hypothetical protein
LAQYCSTSVTPHDPNRKQDPIKRINPQPYVLSKVYARHSLKPPYKGHLFNILNVHKKIAQMLRFNIPTGLLPFLALE